jgi:hypothetical protein
MKMKTSYLISTIIFGFFAISEAIFIIFFPNALVGMIEVIIAYSFLALCSATAFVNLWFYGKNSRLNTRNES